MKCMQIADPETYEEGSHPRILTGHHAKPQCLQRQASYRGDSRRRCFNCRLCRQQTYGLVGLGLILVRLISRRPRWVPFIHSHPQYSVMVDWLGYSWPGLSILQSSCPKRWSMRMRLAPMTYRQVTRWLEWALRCIWTLFGFTGYGWGGGRRVDSTQMEHWMELDGRLEQSEANRMTINSRITRWMIEACIYRLLLTWNNITMFKTEYKTRFNWTQLGEVE